MEEKREVTLDISNQKMFGLVDDQKITDSSKLMYGAYCTALTALDGIMEHKGSRYTSDLYGYKSNIIAFCAERGQGKTSAMLSFSGALMSAHSDQCVETGALWNKTVDGKRFFVLPPIDPTMLNDGESVIELFLSRMLQEVTKLWESPDRSSSLMPKLEEMQKIEILSLFQQCRSCLIHNGEKKDDLGAFRQTGDIFRLKEIISEIVSSFIRLKGWDQKESYLVMQLDDTDMQLKNAYDTLEEVRKYLSIPNLIVLMAADYHQLFALVAKHFAEELGVKSSDFSGYFLEEEVTRIAAKYIDKLIPAPHAVYLPNIQMNWETQATILIEESGQEHNENKKELEPSIFELIYEKTGIVCLKHRSYLHNILPLTLRGLTHLYHLLNSMQTPGVQRNYEPEKTEAENLGYYQEKMHMAQVYLENINQFESYFLNEWCASKLSFQDQKSIRSLNDAYMTQRLRYAKTRTAEKLKKSVDRVSNERQEVSYFELLDFLQQYEKGAADIGALRFLFAEHMYFTIQFSKQMRTDQIASLEKHIHLVSQAQRSNESALAEDGLFMYRYDRLLECFQEKSLSMQKQRDRDFSDWKNQEFLRAFNAKNRPTLFKIMMLQCLELLRIDQNELRKEKKVLPKVRELQDYAAFLCCNWDVHQYLLEHLGEQGEKVDIPSYDQLFQVLMNHGGMALSEVITETIPSLAEDVFSKKLSKPSTTNPQELQTLLNDIKDERKNMDTKIYNWSVFSTACQSFRDRILTTQLDSTSKHWLMNQLWITESASTSRKKGQLTKVCNRLEELISKENA